MTTESRYDALGELERYGAVHLCKPPAKDVRGGEWDAFYALTWGEQMYLRRHWMTDLGTSPDDLATRMGPDVTSDDAWAWWISTVRRTYKETTPATDDRPEATTSTLCDVAELVGPAEVARALSVKIDTVYQWVTRGRLPEPVAIVSGTRLWTWEIIDRWAAETGRHLESALGHNAQVDF